MGTNVEIPDTLVVAGDLDLSNENITKLPEGLAVNGSLCLYNANISKLPDNLKVGGFVDLSRSSITKLPVCLSVGSILDLSNTSIDSLPVGLSALEIFHDRLLYAAESVQIELVKRSDANVHIFVEVSEKAKRLHQMLWEI